MTVTAADIRTAALAIADGIERTLFVHSRTLSEICGTKIWLKLETCNTRYPSEIVAL